MVSSRIRYYLINPLVTIEFLEVEVSIVRTMRLLKEIYNRFIHFLDSVLNEYYCDIIRSSSFANHIDDVFLDSFEG